MTGKGGVRIRDLGSFRKKFELRGRLLRRAKIFGGPSGQDYALRVGRMVTGWRKRLR